MASYLMVRRIDEFCIHSAAKRLRGGLGSERIAAGDWDSLADCGIDCSRIHFFDSRSPNQSPHDDCCRAGIGHQPICLMENSISQIEA